MKNNDCVCSIHLSNDREIHRNEEDYKPEPCLGHNGNCPCSAILITRASEIIKPQESEVLIEETD